MAWPGGLPFSEEEWLYLINLVSRIKIKQLGELPSLTKEGADQILMGPSG